MRHMDELYRLLFANLSADSAATALQLVQDWRRDTAAKLACPDCKRHGGSYMVKPLVWLAAGGAGHLCIACLEVRLGRKLTCLDFSTAPCNDVLAFGLRLARDDVETLPFDDLNRGEFVPAILGQLSERLAELKPPQPKKG